MKLLLLVLAAVMLAAPAIAQVPIPTRPDGYALGTAPASSPVVVDAFFDLLCPDSKAAWPTVKALIAAYPSQLYVLLHTFPLPYHTNAFIANQGLHVVDHATMHNRSAILAYTDLLFSDVQAQFYNAATMQHSMTDVIAALAAVTEKANIISAKTYTAGIADSDINMETRVSWKYTCTRGVAATPTFFINGISTSADASWTLADWRSVIDPLLKASSAIEHRHQPAFLAAVSTAAANTTCPKGEAECDYAPNKYECCLAGEGCIPNVGCRCLTPGAC